MESGTTLDYENRAWTGVHLNSTANAPTQALTLRRQEAQCIGASSKDQPIKKRRPRDKSRLSPSPMTQGGRSHAELRENNVESAIGRRDRSSVAPLGSAKTRALFAQPDKASAPASS
uniref:Uncharacterized protein n=1 Tax=Steinernema glaseri TaxID=37863 RepID=A0A1I7YT08_9BILA